MWDSGIPGAALTITAYDTLYGTAGKIFIGIMTILFGLTTTAGWFAYYAEVIKYIFKNNLKLANTLVNCFKIVFPMMNIIAVSYTHLDVYKRQNIYMAVMMRKTL